MKLRQPAVEGQFYPSSKGKLISQIKDSFLSEFGPGSLPLKRGKGKKKSIAGAISPHAGYQFSGSCAAWAYKEIAESELPDTFVIIGPSHMGYSTCVSLLDWKTPLGTVKNDKEFGKKLASLGIMQDEEAHASEHSIEVQLPFLQFACPNHSIVPIMASTDISYAEIAAAIKNAASNLKRKIMIIASSDFTHYGPAYGYVPFSDNVKDNMFNLDNGAIEKIKRLEASKFMEYVNQKMATICGQIPIAVLLEALDAKKAKLLKYYTSGDIVGDYTNAVGYASIIFQ